MRVLSTVLFFYVTSLQFCSQGQTFVIQETNGQKEKKNPHQIPAYCIFEYIYWAAYTETSAWCSLGYAGQRRFKSKRIKVGHLPVGQFLYTYQSNRLMKMPAGSRQRHRHLPLPGPALSIVSINIEGFSRCKAEIMATMANRFDLLCMQETHISPAQHRPVIPGMKLVAEIRHRQYGSAVFSRPNLKIEEVWTHTTEGNIETINSIQFK